MTELFGTVWRTVLALIAILIAADIVGVVICTALDITPLRWKSALLPYAIWLVLGAFAGLFAYVMAGGWSAPVADEGTLWSDSPGAKRIGRWVIAVSTAVVAGLIGLFHQLYWSRGVNGEFFVPDSQPHSLVFFLAAWAAMIGTHSILHSPAQGPS